MKKSLKKLSLNKKIVSNLAKKTTGGRVTRPIDPITSTDPTKQTWCYICPVERY